MIGIHIDLKYQMPNKQYLHHWLKEIAGLGIDTLLLEYEDKFPFKKYPFLRNAEAFTDSELKAFLATARGAGLRVIPLVQSFSHLEFALAHEQLAELRELPHIPTQINISNPKAVQFVRELQEEVMAWHQEDEFFHLGADETWHVGLNPSYADQVKQKGIATVWADHMKPLIQNVINRGKRPMVWDDIIWNEPAKIHDMKLPKQTVLVSWDYGSTKLLKDDGTERLERVKDYMKAGHQVVAAPCLNWGVLVPRHDHCLRNTHVWAQKARKTGMMGMLNTSWACFHTPLPVQQFHIAATAAMMKDKTVDLAWEKKHFTDWFGCDAAEVPQALRDISVLWEQQVGLSRGLTPIPYGYMDMVLHYKDADERRAKGGYELDWNKPDFVAMFRKKVAMLRDKADEVRAKLDEQTPGFDCAAAVLGKVAAAATKHRDDAALYALFADMKALHARVVRLLVLGEGDRADLHKKLLTQRPRLEALLPKFLEKESAARMIKLWHNPAEVVLGGK